MLNLQSYVRQINLLINNQFEPIDPGSTEGDSRNAYFSSAADAAKLWALDLYRTVIEPDTRFSKEITRRQISKKLSEAKEASIGIKDQYLISAIDKSQEVWTSYCQEPEYVILQQNIPELLHQFSSLLDIIEEQEAA